jgi:hypothetical protein
MMPRADEALAMSRAGGGEKESGRLLVMRREETVVLLWFGFTLHK